MGMPEIVKEAREACGCKQCESMLGGHHPEAREGRPCVANSLIEAWGRRQAADVTAEPLKRIASAFEALSKALTDVDL